MRCGPITAQVTSNVQIAHKSSLHQKSSIKCMEWIWKIGKRHYKMSHFVHILSTNCTRFVHIGNNIEVHKIIQCFEFAQSMLHWGLNQRQLLHSSCKENAKQFIITNWEKLFSFCGQCFPINCIERFELGFMVIWIEW